MLLIYPPVAKPGEPPAGIAKLAGDLQANGCDCVLLDANIEALYYLLEQERTPSDTWSIRAERSLQRNLEALKNKDIYTNTDRYNRAVRDINRVLEQTVAEKTELSLSLVNYNDRTSSPLISNDLLQTAADYELNIYFPYFSKRLHQLLTKTTITTVGLSLNYLSQTNTCFAIIGFLRAHFPSITIILGGGLVTSWSSQPNWKNPFESLVDQWFPGCGTEKLLKFLELENKTTGPPDYTSLPLNQYLSPGTIIPYAASTGCYWNKCSFCPELAEKSPYSSTNIDQTTSDIESLSQLHKPVLLHFLDNALSPSFLRQLANNPPGVPWYGFARVSKELQEQDFCHALRQSGCVMLKLGLESGSQKVLDAMNKGVTVEEMSVTLQNLEQAGIAVYVYLLFGTPYESYQEAQATLEFTAVHHQAISFLNLAIFNMPLYSDDAKTFETTSFSDADLSLYCDFYHPKKWGRKQIRPFLEKEFKKHHLIAPIIHRDPPFFTSNHAPFMTMRARNLPFSS